MIDGIEMFGFPYSTGDDVRSSPAVADLDKNNSLELIIGSHDGSLDILSGFGQQLATYQVNGSINGSPAAIDLDQDGDLEVVFTSYNGSTGDVHAIHHNGSTFYSFPVNLNEKQRSLLLEFEKSLLASDNSPKHSNFFSKVKNFWEKNSN